MRYRLTCLSPVLVGDGKRLAPIDYMVWKDQVNVLDQWRILRLLAKGPRLDGYLSQVRRAERLDFNQWGGFAQNYADRRIPFEHPSMTGYWQRALTDQLHIPTFTNGPSGRFLPGSAIKGALRTGMVFDGWTRGAGKQALGTVPDRMQGDRLPRRLTEAVEEVVVGASGSSRMRAIRPSDSQVFADSALKVYLVRTSTLVPKGPGFEVQWKLAGRGSVDFRRVADSSPAFLEMAQPGTVFEGGWLESEGRDEVFRAANAWSRAVLAVHQRYAERAGLGLLLEGLKGLESRVSEAEGRPAACIVNLGWGGGLMGKAGSVVTEDGVFRTILRSLPYYSRAIQSGLPFPKTRRVVFLNDQPAALPGWALIEVV